MQHLNAQRPLTVVLTSRALFDLDEEDRVFSLEGETAYEEFLAQRLDQPVGWGTAYPLVRTLLAMNEEGKPPLTEVCLLSRNHPYAGLRILGTIEKAGLPIQKAIFTKGRAPWKYLQPMRADLFLSAEGKDVREALDAGIAAATVLPFRHSSEDQPLAKELIVAIDADSTLFSDEADNVFKRGGVDAFHAHEREKSHIPLGPGPFASFFRKLCSVQAQLRESGSDISIRTALVTLRAVAAHARALNTLKSWGVDLDEALFLAGDSKAPFLSALAPMLFVDDSPVHTELAKDLVPTAHVPGPVLRVG